MTRDILKEIDNITNKNLIERHSFFQLKHFVIGREYSTQGKMWQCIRELNTRKASIESYQNEILELNDRIDLLNIKIEKNQEYIDAMYSNTLMNREWEIKIRRLKRKIKTLAIQVISLENKIKDYKEEAEFFISEFDQLNKLEELKPFDDLDAQKEYWTAKLFNEINTKMLLHQPLDAEVVKLVLALNDDSPLKQSMLNILANSNKPQGEQCQVPAQ